LCRGSLRIHRAKLVKQWLAENARKIEAFYLPSYSSELNPNKRLNSDLKQRVTTAAPARNKSGLRQTAVGALLSIQKQPQRVQSYFFRKRMYAMPPHDIPSVPDQYYQL
jgi:transposase